MGTTPELAIVWKGAVGAAELNELFRTHGWQLDRVEDLEAALRRVWGWITARTADGRLIGYVSVLSDGLRHAYVFKLIVHPELRRQGVGGRIMGELMARLEAHRLLPTLVATPGNAGFYERFGFRAVSNGFSALCVR